MRARQRNRNYSVTKGRLIRTGGNSDSYEPKWRHFLPSQRFNFDHSPMPFLPIQKKMYEIIEPGDRYQKRWIIVSHHQVLIKGSVLCRYVLVNMVRNEI